MPTFEEFTNLIASYTSVSRDNEESFSSFSLRVTWGEQFLINTVATLNINKVAGPSISYEILAAGGKDYFDKGVDPARYDALSAEEKVIHDKNETTRNLRAAGASAGGEDYFDKGVDPTRYDALSAEEKVIHDKNENLRKRMANVPEDWVDPLTPAKRQRRREGSRVANMSDERRLKRNKKKREYRKKQRATKC